MLIVQQYYFYHNNGNNSPITYQKGIADIYIYLYIIIIFNILIFNLDFSLLYSLCNLFCL